MFKRRSRHGTLVKAGAVVLGEHSSGLYYSSIFCDVFRGFSSKGVACGLHCGFILGYIVFCDRILVSYSYDHYPEGLLRNHSRLLSPTAQSPSLEEILLQCSNFENAVTIMDGL